MALKILKAFGVVFYNPNSHRNEITTWGIIVVFFSPLVFVFRGIIDKFVAGRRNYITPIRADFSRLLSSCQ